jgi:hypothetical protein
MGSFREFINLKITVAVGWVLATLFFGAVLFGGYTNHAPGWFLILTRFYS